MSSTGTTTTLPLCYHCGEQCLSASVFLAEKQFCCDGCKMVYEILNEHSLCDYYGLNKTPGITQRIKQRKDKFAFLDNQKIQDQLIRYKDDGQIRLTLYLPQVHCSSCLYLLENLHRLNSNIYSGKVNFLQKEIDLVLVNRADAIRSAVETLSSIGYEPYLSLNDLHTKKKAVPAASVYQLGVAGFCFGNIMLMSFPEYLGIDASEALLRNAFRWLNLLLSLPVLLYSALPFYTSSWKSLRHRHLNIDAPIALAILITFFRSAWEVISGSGGGYFDSMSGIVFFMLAGRILQDKTYRQLSFDRDYTSYFPVAVSVLKDGQEVATSLPDIKPGDTLLIHHAELIPVDGILTKGRGLIDYSFVTGESLPVVKQMGELLYAGGKQTGGSVEMLVIREVIQSDLTRLWNQDGDNKKIGGKASFVDLLSRYFTFFVFGIAALTAIYWSFNDQARVWDAVTAIFIIACPCALLLSNSFTNGNILRILSRNQFYLRNAQVIENIAGIDQVVFDKTGTLTALHQQDIMYTGKPLTVAQRCQVVALASCSSHPLSRAVAAFLCQQKSGNVDDFSEITGQGIQGYVDGEFIKLGSAEFINGDKTRHAGTKVYVSFNGRNTGCFQFSNHYRDNINLLLWQLSKHYGLSVLSGDNDKERNRLRQLLGPAASLLFYQMPAQKMEYIRQAQGSGSKVMMIGDGLNDAAALKQSDVGIAVAEHSNTFTPASDAILQAAQLPKLNQFIRLCKGNKKIVIASFIFSTLYNLTGLFFAVQGSLSPMIAAILMPASSLSILLITYGSSNWLARRLKL